MPERQCGQRAPPNARFWAMLSAHTLQTLPWPQGSSTMLPGLSRQTTHCGNPCDCMELWLVWVLTSSSFPSVCRPTMAGETNEESSTSVTLIRVSSAGASGKYATTASWGNSASLRQVDSPQAKQYVPRRCCRSWFSRPSTSPAAGGPSAFSGSSSCLSSCQKLSPPFLNSYISSGPARVTKACCRWVSAARASRGIRFAEWQLKQMKTLPCMPTYCIVWHCPHFAGRMPSGTLRRAEFIPSSERRTRQTRMRPPTRTTIKSAANTQCITPGWLAVASRVSLGVETFVSFQ
mmetsp:Transcript_48639/g.141773  ORF Transcript_48639/g.141773 Transcript_48639/m.141773 type:complete len:291 (-) Transcript_48639:397-1269(-)